MIAKRIADFTHFLGAPAGWKPENGSCVGLAVRQEGPVWVSAWEPTPAELALLNAGGSVILSVYGGQPPVSLTVEEAAE